MSKWDDFKKSVGYYADKTVTKTRELTDTATLKIKIASKEADRDTEYKALGKLTYLKLKGDGTIDKSELTREISETIDKIDKIISEINSLKAEEEEKRASREAEKATKAEKATELDDDGESDGSDGDNGENKT